MTTECDPSDADLIAATRGGDPCAYGELYARHVGAARRLARTLTRGEADAEDLVSDAFARVLAALRAGHGPDLAFRAYLLTTVRHVRCDRARDKKVELTDDLTPYDPGEAFVDPAEAGLERSYAARAFKKLPERWRVVLWHTEVEGESPSQLARLLGLTANGVSALAFRARERLRQMYLQEHVADTADPACHDAADRMGAYVRGGLSTRDEARVDTHLRGCDPCRVLFVELNEVNAGLRGVIAPLVLGSWAAAYLASVSPQPVVSAVVEAVEAPAGLFKWGLARLAAVTVTVAAGAVLAALLVPHGTRQNGTAIGGSRPVGSLTTRNADPDRTPVPAPTRPRATPQVLPALPPLPPAPARPGFAIVLRTTDLSAGREGEVALIVRRLATVTTAAMRAVEGTGEWEMIVAFPSGMSLAVGDAGAGWRCSARQGGAVCRRTPLGIGSASTARLRVRVSPEASGLRSARIVVSAGTQRGAATVRFAIPPRNMFVQYESTARARLALAGNTLSGTATGTRLVLPTRARVAWAGLFWAASGPSVPAAVSVRGPGAKPIRVTAERTVHSALSTQSFADVTKLVRARGAGVWWVAVDGRRLPYGRDRFAGWSLVVVAEAAGFPSADVIVAAGPVSLRGDQSVSLGTESATGSVAQVGLVAYGGDAAMKGDQLVLGGRPLGSPDNVARGAAAGAVTPANSGVDVAVYQDSTGLDGDTVRLRPGDDTLELGVLALATTQVGRR